MIEKIDTHSIDIALLSKGWVLDVGARGFGFARRCAELGCLVLSLDPDKDIVNPFLPNVIYQRKALVGVERDKALYCAWSTGEGNCLSRDGSVPSYATSYDVECGTISQVMKRGEIKHFSAVKLDCEGSEFEILLNWPGPIANQISVEFHDFTGANPRGEAYYTEMLAHLGQWYKIAQHEKIKHECGITGYWDSLFVLK